MRDPIIDFEVATDQSHLVSIRQDFIISYRAAGFVGEDDGVYVRPARVRGIQTFNRIGDYGQGPPPAVVVQSTPPDAMTTILKVWSASKMLLFS